MQCCITVHCNVKRIIKRTMILCLVEFFAKWCDTCIEFQPKFGNIARTLNSMGIATAKVKINLILGEKTTGIYSKSQKMSSIEHAFPV